jgi:tryptophanyl-tRNA synthetase
MAADILMFNAHQVPVGKDQIQHVEMARDIAQRFNHIYGDVFVLPAAVVDERAAILTGLDGRKMSKSYNNTIPLFLPAKQLRKQIMKIKTNSLEPGEPKDPDDSTVFELFSAFADAAAAAEFRQELEAGLAWGDAKQRLFECIEAQLAGPRAEYQRLLEDPAYVEATLVAGGNRARAAAAQTIAAVRHAVGISSLA